MIDTLFNNSACAGLFGGKEKALKKIQELNFSIANDGAYTELAPGSDYYNGHPALTTKDKKNIILNRQGPSVNGFVKIGDTILGSRSKTITDFDLDPSFAAKAGYYQAFILLHELGHAFNIYGKNDKDGADKAINDANFQKIIDACFKEIKKR